MSIVSNPYIFNIKNNYSSKAEINITFTSQSWTSPGTYTWTAPFTGTATVCVIGGGGGSLVNSDQNATNGENSSFDTIIATGGDKGNIYKDENAHGGTPNGKQGYSSRPGNKATAYGVQGFNLNKILESGFYGSSGNAYCNSRLVTAIIGGTGGCNITKINIEKNKNYNIIVGTGGIGGGTSSSSVGYNGNSGAVGIWKE